METAFLIIHLKKEKKPAGILHKYFTFLFYFQQWRPLQPRHLQKKKKKKRKITDMDKIRSYQWTYVNSCCTDGLMQITVPVILRVSRIYWLLDTSDWKWSEHLVEDYLFLGSQSDCFGPDLNVINAFTPDETIDNKLEKELRLESQ